MHHKQPSRSLNHKHRAYSNPIIRPPQRLIFPTKQLQQGYVGKKHFTYKNNDNVSLQSPESRRFVRQDKLDIADIEGARPKNIQPIQNVQKHYKNQHKNNQMRRAKTQAQDSLDQLIKNSPLNTPKRMQTLNIKSQSKSQLQRYLWQRNIQLTKQNILGVYNQDSHQANRRANIIKNSIINPTYLSSLRNN